MNEIKSPATTDVDRCPHFEEVEEETLRRLFSKVAAVRSEDYELFDFTHRSMEVFRGTGAGGETWSEDRIYQEFSEDRIGNFAVVIEGEVGTGKSELCAYLSHQLRLEGRPMLHIDKDDDLMSILSERIPEFYQAQFGEELPGASDFKNLRDDIVEVPQVVADTVTGSAILRLRRQDYDVAPGANQGNEIRDYVAEKLQRLVERGEYAQKIQFVGINEYEQREELQIFEDDMDTNKAVSAFNDALWNVIRDQYNTASLDDVLETVGERFEDTRPVIVFEDFAIAAMEAERLRNYMERDKSSDNWDFVIAGTRDSTEVLHTRTAEDRFEFFQTNEQDSNTVLFLDENSAVDFVRPYLGYIKSHDGSVRYDRNTADGTLTLTEAPSDSICGRCGFCEESFRDLFPFNRSFLRRIYAGLDESQQSPREYIMTIFDVLQEYHEGYIQAPSESETLRPLHNTVSVADEVYEDAEAFADIAKWYGREEGDSVVINRRFIDAFGYETEDLPGMIDIGKEEVTISSTGTGEPDDLCPECGADSWATNPEGDRICSNCGYGGGRGSGLSPTEREIKEQKEKIDSWLEDPEKYLDTDQYIRLALRELLEEVSDEFRLLEGTSLRYMLSSQKSPFVYPDSNEAPQDDQIIIDPRDFRRSDLRHLVEFGVRRDMSPRTADFNEQLEQIGTQLTGYAEEWRNRIIETQLNSDDVFFKRNAGYEFTDFILATYATLTLLDDPWQEVTAESLNEKYQSDDEFDIDSKLKIGLDEVLGHDEIQEIEKAMDDAGYVEDVLGSLLGVSASTLDVPAVRDRLSQAPPYQVLERLGRQYINNISARVRFKSGHNVNSLADAMYDVRSALSDASDHGYQQETVEYVSRMLAGIDVSAINNRYKKLKTYDTVDPDLTERLGQACTHSQSTLDEAVDAAKLSRRLANGDPMSDITAVLASLKLDNNQAVNDFRAVPLRGAGGPDQLGKEFTEVSTHYAD